MALHSNPEWRGQLRHFLNRRGWPYVRWAHELNQDRVAGNRYVNLTKFTLTRSLNSTLGKGEYRGPKLREKYIDLAYTLFQCRCLLRPQRTSAPLTRARILSPTRSPSSTGKRKQSHPWPLLLILDKFPAKNRIKQSFLGSQSSSRSGRI